MKYIALFRRRFISVLVLLLCTLCAAPLIHKNIQKPIIMVYGIDVNEIIKPGGTKTKGHEYPCVKHNSWENVGPGKSVVAMVVCAAVAS
jgi:hypothetical protein